MTTEFVQMGKRGTLVVPAKLRKKLGLTDGCLLVLSEASGKIEIRLAQVEAGEKIVGEQRLGDPDRTAHAGFFETQSRKKHFQPRLA